MDLMFRDPGLQYSIDSIIEFQSDDYSEWWKDSLFVFYPQIDRRHFDSLNAEERKLYLKKTLKSIYEESKPQIVEKLIQYRQHWLKNKQQIEAAFKDAFGMDFSDLFNDLVVNVTLNYINPRFLPERIFDVFYLNSESGALGVSIHELIHFAWFHVWQRLFEDDFSEYEAPSLKWIFSEMVMEPIMRDRRLSSINPYYPEGCVYDYFFSMQIEGKPILETLYEMYKAYPIDEFMTQGYQFCQKHESDIRSQMK